MKHFSITSLLILLLLPLWVYAQGKSVSVTPVIVTTVEVKPFADKIEALGTLKALESVELTPTVAERVTSIHFTDNQRVKKDDVLLVMDSAEEMAELAEQTSYMEEAQRQVDRLSPLVKKGAASASLLDENRRELAVAKARVQAIQARIDQRTITAPFDGVLGLRNTSVGAFAQPGYIITTIDDDSVMNLDFSVPEVFLASLKQGVTIEALTEAYPNTVFKGEIAYVDSRIDPITRAIQARALLPNNESLLKPGLLMQVTLNKNPRQAVLIPEEALIPIGADNFVFVVKQQESKASVERRNVKTGARQYGEVEVVAGLSEGESIVVDGTLRLRPGAQVSITIAEAESKPLGQHVNINAAAN